MLLGGPLLLRFADQHIGRFFAQCLFQACRRAPQADAHFGVLFRRKREVELPVELRRDLKLGRRKETAITIADLTGVAVQDIQIAKLALQKLGAIA
jgi:hypothetical protein